MRSHEKDEDDQPKPWVTRLFQSNFQTWIAHVPHVDDVEGPQPVTAPAPSENSNPVQTGFLHQLLWACQHHIPQAVLGHIQEIREQVVVQDCFNFNTNYCQVFAFQLRPCSSFDTTEDICKTRVPASLIPKDRFTCRVVWMCCPRWRLSSPTFRC